MQKVVIAGLFALAASPAFAQGAAQTAKATFVDQAGQQIGSAMLTQMEKGVLIELDVKNLTPGQHGFHIHQTGKCDGAAKFTSAGGHFAGGGAEHGYHSAKGPHAGDLPNLVIPENGALKMQAFTTGVTLGAGDASLFDADGSALVIHAKADDYKSQPAGDSGDRIACAVIEK